MGSNKTAERFRELAAMDQELATRLGIAVVDPERWIFDDPHMRRVVVKLYEKIEALSTRLQKLEDKFEGQRREY